VIFPRFNAQNKSSKNLPSPFLPILRISQKNNAFKNAPGLVKTIRALSYEAGKMVFYLIGFPLIACRFYQSFFSFEGLNSISVE